MQFYKFCRFYKEQKKLKKITEIESGEYEKSSFSIAFPDLEFSTHNAIGRCDVYNVKIDSNGYLTATIIDYYDFSPKGGFINNNANIQQQNGKLENYALVIPIRMKIKKRNKNQSGLV